MNHILNEKQCQIVIRRMKENYENFKVNNSWGLTDEMLDNYREGVEDFCDSLISAIREETFTIATLRNSILEQFDLMDGNDE